MSDQLTIEQALQLVKSSLLGRYPERENLTIAYLLLEHLNYKKTDIYSQKNRVLDARESVIIHSYVDELKAGIPVQHVLGYAWFRDRLFNVSPDVLIPRPETEELVEWIKVTHEKDTPDILDIGTGSGCIAISLALEMTGVRLSASDISASAIDLAQQNAIRLGAEIDFIENDILDQVSWNSLSLYDLVVSNPPYIPDSEKTTMLPHVLMHEPGLALFVPDEDPMLFYRAILEFCDEHLRLEGWLYFEIHENKMREMGDLMDQRGYRFTELKKDIHGKYRMIRGKKGK